MTKQLSIIVPFYNVEHYIRPFFESVFRQGLQDDIYEMIVVNDGSTDHSMEQVADLFSQHNNITVISQQNQGQSVARNNALKRAVGEYVLFLDSDDLLIDNTLPIMLEKALTNWLPHLPNHRLSIGRKRLADNYSWRLEALWYQSCGVRSTNGSSYKSIISSLLRICTLMIFHTHMNVFSMPGNVWRPTFCLTFTDGEPTPSPL